MNNEKVTIKEQDSRVMRICNKLKLLTIVIFIFYFLPFNLFALDFSLTPGGFVYIPLGSGNTDDATGNTLYGTGGGGELGFEVDLSTIWPNPIGLGYTFGIEAAMLMNSLKSENPQNISFYHAGGNIGLFYFPLSRLLIRADGAVGVYMFAGERGTSDPGLFWRIGGKAGFRFTPSFALAANFGWRQFSSGGVIQNSGLYMGLTTHITFQTGKSNNEGINTALDQYGAVYPAFMQLYQSSPIGSVVIRNNENAEIRDVRMSFRAAGYTASEFPCGTVSIIPRGRSAEVPLLADFSNDILRFTDNGRIMGELVIRYRFLGKEREAVRAVTVAAYNRNTAPADVSALVAFVSPSSPEVLDFARQIAGLERTNRRTGHNQNFGYAIHLAETMKSQIQIKNEQLEMRNEERVQFPAETLIFKSGSARDLALLFAASLESVGISSALIEVKGKREEVIGGEVSTQSTMTMSNESRQQNQLSEILVAVSLDINASQAETLFNGTDKILIIDDTVWLPLSMAAVSEGFMAAWAKGAAVLNDVFAAGGAAELAIISDAWATYPPAPLPELGRTALRTDNTLVTREVDRALQSYITQEINPIIQRTNNQPNTAAQQNRMGILYVRAGRINEAKTSYERAAGMGSVPAMNNRGNLALTEKDYTTAERWFRQALQREPENATAQRGLERIAGNR